MRWSRLGDRLRRTGRRRGRPCAALLADDMVPEKEVSRPAKRIRTERAAALKNSDGARAVAGMCSVAH